jgi:hypothetical protein
MNFRLFSNYKRKSHKLLITTINHFQFGVLDNKCPDCNIEQGDDTNIQFHECKIEQPPILYFECKNCYSIRPYSMDTIFILEGIKIK